MGTLNKASIITFAVCIDGLMAMLSAGLFGASEVLAPILQIASTGIGTIVGTVLGGAGGAIAGAAAGGVGAIPGATAGATAGAGIGGAIGAAFGAGLAAVTPAVGVGLGIALDMSIAFTFGTMFYLWLFISRMWYPKKMWFPALIKTIPILNDLPAFTFTAIRCVIQKNMEEKKLSQKPSKTFGAMLSTSTPLGAAATGVYALNRYTQRAAVRAGVASEDAQTTRREDFKKRTSTDLARMDGIYAKQKQTIPDTDEAAKPLYVRPA